MEIRLPVEGSLGNKFPSIYNHCGVMAVSSRKTLKKSFSCGFVDVLYSNFVKFGRRKIGKIMRCLYDKNSISPGSLALATAQIAPRICQGQPQRMYSERFRLNPNRFTFGGVIPERVNTIKTGHKVFPAFS